MRKILLLVFICFGFSLFSMDLEECIKKGLVNSEELRSQAENREISNLQKKNRFYSFIPSMNLTSGSTKGKDQDLSSNMSFTISENLYLLDSRFFNLKTYDLSYKNAKIEYTQKEKNIILQIISYYTDILTYQGYTEVYENSIKRYEKNIMFTKELIKVGKRTELDLYSLKIDKKENEKLLNQYKNYLKQSKRELKQLTGLNDFDNLTKIDSFSDDFISKEKILEKSLDYEKQMNVLKKSKIEKFRSFKDVIPDLFASGQFSYNKTFDIYGDEETVNTNSWQVSLNASYNFGSIAENLTNYSIRKRNHRITELNTKILEEDLKKEYDSGKDNLELQKYQMQIDKEKLELAQKNFDLADSKYRAGLVSNLDYTDAQNKLIQSKMDYRKSRNDYIKELAEFQNFTGAKILGKY